MSEVCFEELVAPLEPAVFFRDYWQKQIFLGSSAASVGSLVSLADLEFLLTSLTTPGPDWIQVVKAGSTRATSSFCTVESFVSLPKIYGAFAAGYTIQLAKMHKRSAPVGRLCRSADIAFTAAGMPLAHRVGSHLYLTPAHSVGFSPHYDSHDVFVVQVQGTKRWKIYGALEEFPVEMQQGDVPRDRLPPLSHDILLEAGQVLYVPRGIFHEALAEDRHSIHVTLDVFPYTWADLVARLMRAEGRFRAALPVGTWTEDGISPALAAGLRERLDELLAAGDLAGVASGMLEDFVGGLDTLPADGLGQLLDLEAVVTLDTVLARRPGSFAQIIAKNGNLELRFPSSGFGGPAALVPVFRFLRDSPRFAVRDLPSLLSGESKLAIAKELIREGFLEIAGSP
ncbi:MAG TPA: cupin domain-containing protein [Thermoanaerobaculia bacterium]|jgi:hypothetical protein